MLVRTQAAVASLAVLVLFACFDVGVGQIQQSNQTRVPQNIRVSNTSKLLRKGEYQWTMYVDADQAVLDQIATVEYLLHPAFDDPDRKVDSPRKGPRAFSTSGTAFKPAKIGIAIQFRNGEERRLEYTLRLRSSFANLWYVVLGYFGAGGWDRAQSLARAYQQKGFRAFAVDTNSGDFPNFDRGVFMVVIGPGSQAQAQALLRKVPTLSGQPYIQQAARY